MKRKKRVKMSNATRDGVLGILLSDAYQCISSRIHQSSDAVSLVYQYAISRRKTQARFPLYLDESGLSRSTVSDFMVSDGLHKKDARDGREVGNHHDFA